MRRIVLFIICVSMAVLAWAGNVVTLPTVTGSPGEEITLSLALSNTDAVSAVQVAVPVGDGFAVAAGSETLSSRATGHSARVGIRDGMLVVMVWNNGLGTIAPGEGDLLTFSITLGDEPQTIPLIASRVTLTDADGNALDATATSGSVTIAAPKAQLATRDIDFGHIPIRDVYHQSLQVTNVGNVPLVISGIDPSAAEFSSETAFPYTIEAGNTGYVDITYAPVERGAIEETVRLLSNNIAGTNTIRIVADPFAVNELHVENASGIADSTVTIPLRVNNMDAISGFQFEFDLPSQLKYVDGSFKLSNRSNGHQLTVTCQGQHLTAIAWSLTDGATFNDYDGEIASFDVVLCGRNSCNLDATKAILTARYRGEDMDVLSAKYSGRITIQSPQLSAPTSLNMGATPVTHTAQALVSVRNNGNAPLRIDRVVFDTEGFAIAETVPLVISARQSAVLHVSYDGQEQASYEAWMQLYSNDPDHRLHNIRVTGSRFAPNYLTFTADDVINDTDMLLHVDMSNYDPVEGLQFDLTYPHQWFAPTGEYTTTDRASGFSVTQRSVGQGIVRCFVYSLADGEMAAGEGRILTLPFTTTPGRPDGEYSLTIDNIKAGTSALTDKYAGATEHASFHAITVVYATSISLDRDSAEMTEGDTLRLIANVQPDDVANPTVKWSSSDEDIATVDENGTITAVSEGNATITATTCDGSDLTATCEISVKPAIILGDMNLDGTVDVSDVNIVINIILKKDSAENYDRRAYITDDDYIDVSDVNAIINIILKKE